jgi:uncharacterized protein (TIGR03083 family)
MSDTKKEEIREALTSARQELLSLLSGLGEWQWAAPVFTHEEEDGWSVADVLRHLVDSERGMTAQMKIIGEGGEGVPPDFDLNRWNARAVTKAKDKVPAELLAEMEKNREGLLQFIDSLASEDWHKQGRHASLRIMSIEEIARLIASHERRHTADIREALERIED